MKYSIRDSSGKFTKKCIFPNGCGCEHHLFKSGLCPNKPCDSKCKCSCMGTLPPKQEKKEKEIEKVFYDFGISEHDNLCNLGQKINEIIDYINSKG